MDVDDARRAPVRAVAVRPRAQGGVAADRGRRRRRPRWRRRTAVEEIADMLGAVTTCASCIAGFGPFPGAPINPSALLVRGACAAGGGRPWPGSTRTAHVFATTYAAVDRDLPKLFAAKPDIVLMFGLAGRRRQLCIETRARNAVSVLFPDASGHRPQARRHCARRAAIAPRQRAVRAPSRRGAGKRDCRHGCRAMPDAICATTPIGRPCNARTAGEPLIAFVHIPPVRLAPRGGGAANTVCRRLRRLVDAAEALLIALIAASRR